MFPRSLTFRLIAMSGAWVVGSLVAAALLLLILFRAHIERRFDQELYDHLEELVAASELAPLGKFELTWRPADPRFIRPYSGWYWQITQGEHVVARSASAWQSRLNIGQARAGIGPQTLLLVGPEGQQLRALVEDITLPEDDRHYAFVVAGPVQDIERDVTQFSLQLGATLGVLGLGLLAAVLLQVRFGLRPLRTMGTALAAIRSGASQRLPGTFPAEVRPVVSELNALLDSNAAMLERARTQAANLAHALKNPLTVIRNESRDVEGERGKILREQAAAVNGSIERYLARARAAGPAGLLSARTSLAEAVENLRFSMDLLYKDRSLDIRVTGVDDLLFRGDSHDLEEMLGNLMDNACKWARGQVLVSGKQANDRLLIVVADDGPGIPEERRGEALRPGRRLDETREGSGLGLPIVGDIAALYGGTVRLEASPLGGIQAALDLPAAE
jgi:signal transduction histidine kinase